MTLDELNEHLDLLRRLRTARELLAALRASSLRASEYDGMPHTSAPGDKVAALAIKCAEQAELVRAYERRVAESERAVRAFVDTIDDNRANLVFYLRFVCGEDWQRVAENIGGGNTAESVKSLCYRWLNSRSAP